MADKEPVVYLEDVEVNGTTVKETETSSAKPAAVAVTAAASTSVKRQLTLADMFSPSQGKAPIAKKQKTTMSAVTSAQNQAGSSSLAATFSVSSFRESLSDEQKDLLELECEVMGETWQVN
jgi:uracil-DNA glycosylase